MELAPVPLSNRNASLAQLNTACEVGPSYRLRCYNDGFVKDDFKRLLRPSPRSPPWGLQSETITVGVCYGPTFGSRTTRLPVRARSASGRVESCGHKAFSLAANPSARFQSKIQAEP